MKDISHYLSLLSEFASKYAAGHGISRIGIFGSVARGEHKVDSDIVYNKPQFHKCSSCQLIGNPMLTLSMPGYFENKSFNFCFKECLGFMMFNK